MGDGLDPISLEQFGNLVLKDPVAYRAFTQMQKIGADVKLDFGFSGRSGIAGEAVKDFSGIEISVFMNEAENLTAKGAVSTFVHESSHAMRASRGFQIGTKLDEFQAFRREALFNLGRRPTLAERRAIWDDIIMTRYSTHPTGGELPTFLRPGY